MFDNGSNFSDNILVWKRKKIGCKFSNSFLNPIILDCILKGRVQESSHIQKCLDQLLNLVLWWLMAIYQMSIERMLPHYFLISLKGIHWRMHLKVGSPYYWKRNIHLGRYALHQNSFMNKSCFPAEVFLIPDLSLWRCFFLYCVTEMVNSKLLKSDLKSLMKEPDAFPDFSFPLWTKALNDEGWKAYYHQKEM